MKSITSALVAMLVLAGVAGAAQAFDAKTFYEQVDRNHNWRCGPALNPKSWLGEVTCELRSGTMKTLISALLALLVLSGSAASALADKVPQSIWEQLDWDGRGGHPT
jgi:hypothetical protein